MAGAVHAQEELEKKDSELENKEAPSGFKMAGSCKLAYRRCQG